MEDGLSTRDLALPLKDPGKDHCGTASTGWLSGWNQPGNKDPPGIACSRPCSRVTTVYESGGPQKCSLDGKCPPANYNTPGSYPLPGQALSNHTICFNANHWSSGRPCGASVPVGVAHCGRFLLWRLMYTPGCCSCGYCTAPTDRGSAIREDSVLVGLTMNSSNR